MHAAGRRGYAATVGEAWALTECWQAGKPARDAAQTRKLGSC